MKTIPIWDKKNLYWDNILVDDEDLVRVQKYSWFLNRDGYPVTNYYRKDGKRRPLLIARYIMNLTEFDTNIEVDHISRNKLDNQKINLRICDHQQNQHNTGPSSLRKYKGAYFHKQSGRWQSMIMHNGKIIALGLYETEIEAARAYDIASKKYHGEFGYQNFSEEVK